MKKMITILLVGLLFCSSITAAAAGDFTAAVGEIMIPFHVDGNWQVNTPGKISRELCEKRALDEKQLTAYMYAFHYCLWLYDSRSDAEIMVVHSADAAGADYRSMTDAQLHAVISERARAYTVESTFVPEKIETYHAGNVLFVKYTVLCDGAFYGVFFETTVRGNIYEVRFLSGNGRSADKLQQDVQRVVDAIGTALTFPENYEKAPVTTAPSLPSNTDSVINLPGGEGDGELNLGDMTNSNGADVSRTPAVPAQTDAGNKVSAPAEATNAEGTTVDTGIVEIGTDGMTLIIHESVPSAEENATGSSAGKVCIAVAVIALVAIAVVALFVAKKKKEK